MNYYQDLIELLLAKREELLKTLAKTNSLLEQCGHVEPVVEVEPQPEQEPDVEEQPQVEVNDGTVIY